YRGKRIRFSGYLKSKDIQRGGMLSMVIYRDNNGLYATAEMDGREVFGPRDWSRFDIVSDVPPDGVEIRVRTIVVGEGTLWADGLEVGVVGKDVPTHDDHGWRTSG